MIESRQLSPVWIRNLLALSYSLCLASCCMHKELPNLPSHWRGKEITANQFKDKKSPRAQVIIMYGKHFCSHTALRLYVPGKGAMFWDPGGGYSTKHLSHAVRSSDVIKNKAPSIDQYIQWRHDSKLPVNGIEIFDYTLTGKQALELWAILDQGGVAKNHPKYPFNTNAVGLFCGHSVSNFVERFLGNKVKVRQDFLPHNLSAQLYQQSFDQLIIYRNRQYALYKNQ